MVDPGSDEAGCEDDLPADHALDLPPVEPPPNVPAGSLIDTQPHSPTSPFEFLFSPTMSSLESQPPGLSVLNVATIPDFLSL